MRTRRRHEAEPGSPILLALPLRMHIEFERGTEPFADRRRSRATRCRLIGCALAGIALAIGPGSALAKINKCVDPKTHAPILSEFACPDATLPSSAEVAASAEAARVAKNDEEAARTARVANAQLLGRFPDEAAHRTAEAAEIDAVIHNIRITMRRFDELAAERKPLDVQAAFYVGKTMPPTLRRAIDDNEASFRGLVDTFRGQERSVADIVAHFRTEREQLRKLWSGTK
jgi:hypothetical protein